MPETTEKTNLWLIDSERKPLAECRAAFDGWADVLYLEPDGGEPDWTAPPDAIFFSAEIAGGAEGEAFAQLREAASGIPLLAVAGLRSLTQALAFFRAGADDYLPLPLDEGEARERLEAVLEKARRRALEAVLLEVEAVDPDSAPAGPDQPDILETLAPAAAPAAPEPEREPDADDDPEPVDGLPIPTLWEELPCGLLVFDSVGNLVFANSLGLELFGHASLAELQEALENRPSSFAAHAANHKPLPDNQWPQVLARKARAARSAVVSIEKPDRRRVWLRIDCLPHLAEGKVNRLAMTLVNLTGELPALTPPASPPPREAKPRGRERAKRRGGRKG